jgi:lipopolysaccharide export LptBFGC system permease protein LptF
MSDPQPQPPDSGSRASLLGCLGAVMLLPGLCSLAFVFMFVRDIFTRGIAVAGEAFPEILLLWVPSFLIAALGVALIRADRRS